MTYLNGKPGIVRTSQYLRATLPQRAVWFALWCYCHEHDNGGRIGNWEDWTDSMWHGIQADPVIVREKCLLWTLKGFMLEVHFYDIDAEAIHLKRVAMGRKYAQIRWTDKNAPKPRKSGHKNGSPIGSAIGIPIGSANAKVGREVGKDYVPHPPQHIPPARPVVGRSRVKRHVTAPTSDDL